MQGAAGAAGGATYVDDVFNTYLWKGTAGSQTINNGIDLAGEGGLVWTKVRSIGDNHALMDSTRKTNTYYDDISSSATYASQPDRNWGISSLNNNGFTLGGSNNQFNSSGATYASWTFRKSKGFFDIVTYTGNATTRTISHSLGSVPGLILIKDLTSAHDWVVYHKSMGNESFGKLNTTNSFWTGNDIWNSTSPTSSNFTIKGNNSFTNTNGNSYVAYVFAGGESTAATARSVDFDGNDYLIAPASSDLNIGSSDFTCEAWVYPTNYGEIVSAFNQSGQYVGWLFGLNFNGPTGKMAIWLSGTGGSGTYHANSVVPLGQWSHVAFTKSGTTYKFYLNGTFDGSFTSSITSSTSQQDVRIGADNNSSPGRYLTGKISNLRITKGQVVYTDSFKPSTEPLTTTSQGATASNVKLLCCNNSSVTGATVIPTGSLSTYGDPTASTNSPFDDPNGFKFGEEGDQNIIKTGSYVGRSGANNVYLGWEPQWVMVKNVDSSEPWVMVDSMRGWANQSSGAFSLKANSSGTESVYNNWGPSATGWVLDLNNREIDMNEQNYIYIAMRRPDPLVAKPPEVGTDVFNMVMGTSNSDVPAYVSGFPVDFAFNRVPVNSENWWTQFRLTGNKYVIANSTAAEASSVDNKWDYNNGWYAATNNQSAYQSWMWKRHAGFDVVTYKGNSTGSYSGMSQVISHNLGKVPEMIWCKNRDATGYWGVYHKGLNGGTNPENYRMLLNDTHAESAASGSYTNWYWNNTAPTATQFSVGEVSNANANNTQIIAMLFASVDGISKVGSYTGTGASGNSITLGFQPRFLLIKNANNASVNWVVYDTVRGWTGTNDKFLNINQNYAQGTTTIGPPTSTGFTVNATNTSLNSSGDNFVYYAHA